MAEWLILELKEKAEGEDPDLIRSSIRRRIKDAEVFIPALVTKTGDETVIRYLVEGYAFIKRTRADDIYLKLRDSTYVETIVSTGSKFSTVGDKEIDHFRSQIEGGKPEVAISDKVIVTAGVYESIEGTVQQGPSDDDTVQIFITLRSMQMLATVPRACLRRVDYLNPAQTGEPKTVEMIPSDPAHGVSEPGPSATLTALCVRLRVKTHGWAAQIRVAS